MNNLNEWKLKWLLNSANWANFIFDCLILTFLKTSREHAILPKHSSVTGSCEISMIVGSILWISIGNIYQLNWSMVISIPSNASFILWPSSEAINTKVSAIHPFKLAFNNTRTTSPWYNWNRFIMMNENVKKGFGTNLNFGKKIYSTNCIWKISIAPEIARRLHVKSAKNMGWRMLEKSRSILNAAFKRLACNVSM